MKFYFLALLFLVSSISFSSNNLTNSFQSDSLTLKKADSSFNLARSLFSKERKSEEALIQFNIADSLYQSLGQYERVILTKRNKHVCRYALRQSFEKQIEPLNEGLEFIQKADQNSPDLGVYYFAYANLYSRFYEYENARFYGLKAFRIFELDENKDKPDYLVYRFGNMDLLGGIELNLSNTEIAENYFFKSLALSKEKNRNINRIINELFNLYRRTNQVDKIEAILKDDAKNNYFKDAPLFDVFDFYNDKILYYTYSDQFELALQTADSIETIIQNSAYKAHFSKLFFNRRKAEIYFEMGDYDKAIKILKKTLLDPDLKVARSDERTRTYTSLAACYFKQGNIKKAIENLDLSFENNYINNPTQGFYDKIDASNLLIEGGSILDKLYLKAQVITSQYENSNDITYLNSAIHTYETLNDVIKVVGRMSHEDKFLTPDFYNNVYGGLLELYFQKWSLKNSDELFYQAFNICDESKTVTVLNEISSIEQSRLFHSISKSVIDQEKQFQLNADSINRIYKSAKNNALIKTSKDSINLVFQNFKKDLEQQYPNYYQLRYGTEKSVEFFIKEKYSTYNIIQFFWSEKAIYIFNKNGDIVQFDKVILNKDLNNHIDKLLRSLRENNNLDYKVASVEIYNNLFKKYIDSNKKTAVVLDDKLHLLPIEALWTSLDKNGHFLLEDSSVLRLNSIKQDVVLPNSKTKSLLLFAPYASTNSQENSGLSGSLHEVNEIKKVFSGDIFLDENASKKEFLNLVQNYPIIHLATHSLVDENNPLGSKIYFNNSDSLNPGKSTLKVEELYNMKLNSDLVTLSSCETGIGKEIKGKGVLSISNAFAFAGVSSTVMSLWKVPDKETSSIIVAFYENLSKGQHKDEALSNAKLHYLKTTSDLTLKHPFYWSGFVISGDPSPINDTSNSLYYILIGLFVLLSAFFLRKKINPNH